MANHTGAIISHELKQYETDDRILMTIMVLLGRKNVKKEFGLVALNSCPDRFYKELGEWEEPSYPRAANETVTSCGWGNLNCWDRTPVSTPLFLKESGLHVLTFENKSSDVLVLNISKAGSFKKNLNPLMQEFILAPWGLCKIYCRSSIFF